MEQEPRRRPFDIEYLSDYSFDHVFYEFDMLLRLAQIYEEGATLAAKSEDLGRLSNAILEAFVLHLRNVLDFLYEPDKPRPTDVLAADYFEPGEWKEIRPLLSSTLKDARRRANKEMAHLTTERIPRTPEAKEWDCAGLIAELRPIMELMAEKAHPFLLASNVKNILTNPEG